MPDPPPPFSASSAVEFMKPWVLHALLEKKVNEVIEKNEKLSDKDLNEAALLECYREYKRDMADVRKGVKREEVLKTTPKDAKKFLTAAEANKNFCDAFRRKHSIAIEDAEAAWKEFVKKIEDKNAEAKEATVEDRVKTVMKKMAGMEGMEGIGLSEETNMVKHYNNYEQGMNDLNAAGHDGIRTEAEVLTLCAETFAKDCAKTLPRVFFKDIGDALGKRRNNASLEEVEVVIKKLPYEVLDATKMAEYYKTAKLWSNLCDAFRKEHLLFEKEEAEALLKSFSKEMDAALGEGWKDASLDQVENVITTKFSGKKLDPEKVVEHYKKYKRGLSKDSKPRTFYEVFAKDCAKALLRGFFEKMDALGEGWKKALLKDKVQEVIKELPYEVLDEAKMVEHYEKYKKGLSEKPTKPDITSFNNLCKTFNIDHPMFENDGTKEALQQFVNSMESKLEGHDNAASVGVLKETAKEVINDMGADGEMLNVEDLVERYKKYKRGLSKDSKSRTFYEVFAKDCAKALLRGFFEEMDALGEGWKNASLEDKVKEVIKKLPDKGLNETKMVEHYEKYKKGLSEKPTKPDITSFNNLCKTFNIDHPMFENDGTKKALQQFVNSMESKLEGHDNAASLGVLKETAKEVIKDMGADGEMLNVIYLAERYKEYQTDIDKKSKSWFGNLVSEFRLDHSKYGEDEARTMMGTFIKGMNTTQDVAPTGFDKDMLNFYDTYKGTEAEAAKDEPAKAEKTLEDNLCDELKGKEAETAKAGTTKAEKTLEDNFCNELRMNCSAYGKKTAKDKIKALFKKMYEMEDSIDYVVLEYADKKEALQKKVQKFIGEKAEDANSALHVDKMITYYNSYKKEKDTSQEAKEALLSDLCDKFERSCTMVNKKTAPAVLNNFFDKINLQDSEKKVTNAIKKVAQESNFHLLKKNILTEKGSSVKTIKGLYDTYKKWAITQKVWLNASKPLRIANSKVDKDTAKTIFNGIKELADKEKEAWLKIMQKVIDEAVEKLDTPPKKGLDKEKMSELYLTFYEEVDRNRSTTTTQEALRSELCDVFRMEHFRMDHSEVNKDDAKAVLDDLFNSRETLGDPADYALDGRTTYLQDLSERIKDKFPKDAKPLVILEKCYNTYKREREEAQAKRAEKKVNGEKEFIKNMLRYLRIHHSRFSEAEAEDMRETFSEAMVAQEDFDGDKWWGAEDTKKFDVDAAVNERKTLYSKLASSLSRTEDTEMQWKKDLIKYG